jgi:transcriptional regulator with XRE-family HTH domain
MLDAKIATRSLVSEMMRVTGLDATGLARKAGLAPSTLTRFLNNQDASHSLSYSTLIKLSAVSGVTIGAAVSSGHRNGSSPGDADGTIATRLRAARWACWGEDKERAAWALNTPVEFLDDMVDGKIGVPLDFLVRFCGLTGCPMNWLLHGRWDQMAPVMAARIVFHTPALVPAQAVSIQVTADSPFMTSFKP